MFVGWMHSFFSPGQLWSHRGNTLYSFYLFWFSPQKERPRPLKIQWRTLNRVDERRTTSPWVDLERSSSLWPRALLSHRWMWLVIGVHSVIRKRNSITVENFEDCNDQSARGDEESGVEQNDGTGPGSHLDRRLAHWGAEGHVRHKRKTVGLGVGGLDASSCQLWGDSRWKGPHLISLGLEAL